MKKLILILLILSPLFFLSGCSWTKDIQIKAKAVDRIPLVLPDSDIYYHRQLEWVVVTKDNVDEVFTNLQKRGKALAIIGLTGDDYELLALNTSDQQVLIKQLNAIIAAYKKYYIAVEKRDSIEESNVEPATKK